MSKELATRYLSTCETQRNLSNKTLKAYRIDLQQFVEFHGETQSFSKESILEYIEALNAKYKPQTVKRKIASIRAFLQHLEEEQVIEENPFKRIKLRMRTPKILPRVIPMSLIEKMLRIAHQDIANMSHRKKAIAIQNALVLELLFSTGMRVGELCGLSRLDVNIETGTLLIMGKGAKERLLQIGNDKVIKLLKDHCSGCAYSSSALFINRIGNPISEQSIRTIVKGFARRVDAQMHITPHMFRHSFATALIEANVDIRYIQKLLGHSSIMTTQIYTAVSTAKQREVLVNCHPRNQMAI